MLRKQDILQSLVASEGLNVQEIATLKTEILQNSKQAQAFNITAENIQQEVQRRSQLLHLTYPQVEAVRAKLKIAECLIEPLWDVWLPLGMWLAQQQTKLQRPLIQGIVGSQGSGKTTLGIILQIILQELGYSSISISLDDFYKTYADRMLLRSQDPRLIWRGPPGTHDIQVAINVLEQFKQPQSSTTEIPRFDKSAYDGEGDRTIPELVKPVDIVLFEGWFVGVHPVNNDSAARIFAQAPAPIITEGDRQFAQDMNANLAAYLPLWECLDSLILLDIPDYHLSKQWRQQAETKSIQAGLGGMSNDKVDEFVNYFWRSLHPEIFLKPLRHNSERVDLVIEINEQHLPKQVYQPLS